MRTRVQLEIWVTSPIYGDCYSVSSFGNVQRIKPTTGATVGKLLKFNKNKNGYLYIHLYKNNKRYAIEVSTLVCEAFHGSKPSIDHETNHKNGHKHDNRECNLEWTTPQGNTDHAISNKLKNDVGEFNTRAKRCLFVSPKGRKYLTKGLNKFCRDKKLDSGAMSAIARGKSNQHKGWTCSYV